MNNNFDYSKFYEGTVLSVDSNNECLVSVPMLFFDRSPSEIEIEESINNENIENNDLNKKTITSVNGIYCKPFYSNGINRMMNVGETVTVFFKHHDPQKPFFINGCFINEVSEYIHDNVYKNKDIEIYTEFNPPRILFRVKNHIVEINENTMLGGGFGGNGSGAGGTGTGNILTNNTTTTDDIYISVIKDMYIKDIIADGILDVTEKKFIEKEMKKISQEFDLIIQLAELYMEDEDVKKLKEEYEEKKNTLFDYLAPMMADMTVDSVIEDTDLFYNNFMDYYKTRCKILEELVNAIEESQKNAKEYSDIAFVDGIFQQIEKEQLTSIMELLIEEKPIITSLALLFKVFPGEYTKAYEKLYDFLYDEKTGLLLDLSVSSKIEDTEEFKKIFIDSFITKLALFKAILKASQADMESKMEAVKVGSANLSLNSNFAKGIKKWYPSSKNYTINKNEIYTNELNLRAKSIYNDLSVSIFKGKIEDDLTFSFYCKVKENTTVRVYLADKKKKKFYSAYNDIKISNKEFERVQCTFKLIDKVKATNIQYPPKLYIELKNGNEITYGHVKLEFGTVATDWTPAPEDIEQIIQDGITESSNKIEEVKSTIKQTADTIQATIESIKAQYKEIYDETTGNRHTITEVEQKFAEFLLTLDEIKLGLEHNYGRIEILENDLTGYKKTVTTIREQVSQIDMTISSINMLVKDFQKTVTEIIDDNFYSYEEIIKDLETSLKLDLDGIHGSVSSLESSIKETNKTIESTGEKITLLEKNISKKDAEFQLTLDQIKLRLTSVEDNYTNFESELNGKINNIVTSEVEKKVSGITADIDSIKGEVGDFKTSMTQVTTALNGKADISLVESVDNKYSSLEQTTEFIKGTVESNKSDISILDTSIKNFNDPGKATPVEKAQLKMQYDELLEQKNALIKQADVFKIVEEKEILIEAFDKYHDFLFAPETGLLIDMEKIDVYNRAELENLLKAVYEARENLTAKLAKTTKDIADYNKEYIDAMGDDNKITPAEKQEIKRIFNEITIEKDSLLEQAEVFSLGTSALENAYNELYNYLYGPGGLLISMNVTTNINQSIFDGKFNKYYTERSNLSKKILIANKENLKDMIGAVKLGASNMCRNSNFCTGDTKYWSFLRNGSKSDLYDDARFEKYLNTDYLYTKEALIPEILSLNEESELMVSGWIRGKTTDEYVFIYLIESNTLNQLSEKVKVELSNNEWKYFDKPFVNCKTIAQNEIALLCIEYPFNNGYSYDITNTQLEFGNIATAWKPCVEDISDQFDGKTEIIRKEFDDRMSSFEETTSGITGDISSIRGSLTTINNELGDRVTSSTFEVLEKKVAGYKQTIDENSANLESVTDIIKSHETSLKDMYDNTKMTPGEKANVKIEFNLIEIEKERLKQQAEYFNITTEKDYYLISYGKLYDFLMINPAPLQDPSTTTIIDREKYNEILKNYDSERNNLMAKIFIAISELSSNAKKESLNIIALIKEISADGIINLDDKNRLKIEIDKIKKEYPDYCALAEIFGNDVKNKLKNYKTAYNDLISYMDEVLSSLNDTVVSQDAVMLIINNYYDCLFLLLSAIMESSKKKEEGLTSKITDIKIGGTNLLKNTNFKNEELIGWELYGDHIEDFILSHNVENGNITISDTNKTRNSGNIGIISENITSILEKGNDYCLSFMAYGNSVLDHLDFIGILDSSNYFNRLDTINIPTDINSLSSALYTVFQVPKKIIAGRLIIGFVDLPVENDEELKSFTIWNIKLEKGNIPTDWNESLEDIKDKVEIINRAYSSFEQTVNGIKTTVGEQGQIINSYENRISANESNIAQNSTSISTLITSIDNIEVGLENLYPNSGRSLLQIEDWEWDPEKSSCDIATYPLFGFETVCLRIKNDQENPYLKNKLKIAVVSNYYYAFSCKIAGNVNLSPITFYLIQYNSDKNMISQQNELIDTGNLKNNLFKYKFITSIDTKYIGIQFIMQGKTKDTLQSVLYVNELMLQSGPVFSCWTPAIEDMETNLDSVNSLLEDIQKDSTKIMGSISDILSDSKITTDEKIRLQKEISEINNEENKYLNLIGIYLDMEGANEVKNAYTIKRKALDDYMKPILKNLKETTDVNRIEMNNVFQEYFDARQDLVNKASEFAKNKADKAQQDANTANNEITATKTQISGIVQTINGLNSTIKTVESSIDNINSSIGSLTQQGFNNFSITKNLEGWTNSSDNTEDNKLYLYNEPEIGTVGRLNSNRNVIITSPYALIYDNLSYRINVSFKKPNISDILKISILAYDNDKNLVDIGKYNDESKQIEYSKKATAKNTNTNSEGYSTIQFYIMNKNFQFKSDNYPKNINCDFIYPLVLKENTSYLRLELDYNANENILKTIYFYNPILSTYDNNIESLRVELNEFNNKLNEFSQDNVLTVLEKKELELMNRSIIEEKPGIVKQAGLFLIGTSEYVLAYNNLQTYLHNSTKTGILDNMTDNLAINRNELNEKFSNYFSNRQWLLDNIASKQKDSSLLAQSKAEAAKEEAEASKSILADYASDSILTPLEKRELYNTFINIQKEKETVINQAKIYSLEYLDFERSYTDLDDYLTGFMGLLADMSSNSPIIQSVFNEKFANYYQNRQLLLDKIANSSKNYSDGILTTAKEYTDNNINAKVETINSSFSELIQEQDRMASILTSQSKTITEIQTSVDKANNLSIGGTNLLKNTLFVNISGKTTYEWEAIGNHLINFDSSNKYENCNSLKILSNGIGNSTNLVRSYIDVDIKNDQEYMISFYAKSTTENTQLHCELYGGREVADFSLTTSWKKYSHKLIGSTSKQYFCFWLKQSGDCFIVKPKLEEGNISTSWSPNKADSDVNASEEAKKALEDAKKYAEGEAKKALEAAEAAKAIADSAKGTLSNMSSDNVVTAIEKKTLKNMLSDIKEEYKKIINDTNLYSGIDTSKLTNKYNILVAYLTNTETGILRNMDTDTNVVRSEFTDKFDDYYKAKQEVLNNSAEKAKEYASSMLQSSKKYSDDILKAYSESQSKIQSGVDQRLGTIEIFVNTQTQTNTTFERDITSLTDKYNDVQDVIENPTPILDKLQVGGTNLLRIKNIVQAGSESFIYDSASRTYTITVAANRTSTWGEGITIIGKECLIPYGSSYICSFEILVPIDISWNVDINNYAAIGNSWSGNDNDEPSKRRFSNKNLKANIWTKCYFCYSNTNSRNVDKQPIYDASQFGVVNRGSDPITFKIRNVKGELGNTPTDWSPNPLDVEGYADKAASNTLEIAKKYRVIYAKGSGNDFPSTPSVKVAGVEIASTQGRGLRIIALDKITLEKVFMQTYDTFGSDTEKVDFASKINSLNDEDRIIIVTSNDASRILSSPVREALQSIGGTLPFKQSVEERVDSSGLINLEVVVNKDSYREAYALIGKSRLSKGNGLEMFIPKTAEDHRYAEVSVRVSEEGDLIGLNSNNIYDNLEDISGSINTITRTSARLITETNSIGLRADRLEQSEKESRKVGSFRYLRDWLNGSTANNGNHWVDIQIISNGTNIAKGITPTSNKTIENPNRITDEVIDSSIYSTISSTGWCYVQLDLGSERKDIDLIKIWHCYADGRAYNTKLQVSRNGTDWFTLYNSENNGQYKETNNGRIYVINESNFEKRLQEAEIKVSPNSIVSTVRSSHDYQQDLGGKASASDLSRLTSRVKAAEEKITDDAIVRTITESETYQSDQQKINTTIKETATSITNSFTKSGGFNRILNSTGYFGTNFWNENVYNYVDGGNTDRAIRSQKNVYTGNETAIEIYAMEMSSGYYGISQKVETVIGKTYTLSALIAGHRSNKLVLIQGTTNDPLGWLSSQYYGDIGGGTNLDNWVKVSITFTAERTETNIEFDILKCTSTENKSGYFWVKQVMLNEGPLAMPWTQNPNETYGTSIEQSIEGLRVFNSESTYETLLDNTGLTISSEGGTLAEFTYNKAYIPKLESTVGQFKEIYADNIPYVQETCDYYVNLSSGNNDNDGLTSSKAKKSIQEVLDGLGKVFTDSFVNIYISGTGTEDIRIAGFIGAGKLVLNFDKSSKLYTTQFDFIGCTIEIGVTGNRGTSYDATSSAQIILTSSNDIMFYNRNCLDVHVNEICGLSKGTGNTFAQNYGGNTTFDACEIDKFMCVFDCHRNSKISFGRCIGSDNTGLYNGHYGGLIQARSGSGQTVPNFTKEYQGHQGDIHVLKGSDYNKHDGSIYKPASTPPAVPTATTTKRSWTLTNIYSDETLNGWSDKRELIQGYYSGWATGRWTGWMTIPQSVRDALSGSTVNSGRVYLHRNTSEHGTTTSTINLYASDGSTITTSKTITRGQGVWIDIPSAVLTKIKNGSVKKLYVKHDSSSSSHYIRFYSDAKIEMTYTK